MIQPTDNGVYSLYSPEGRNAWGKSVVDSILGREFTAFPTLEV